MKHPLPPDYWSGINCIYSSENRKNRLCQLKLKSGTLIHSDKKKSVHAFNMYVFMYFLKNCYMSFKNNTIICFSYNFFDINRIL